jgi:lipopolysaccharide/colanic/teichoic acid biosynthesis glycosyltransferase
MATHYVRSWSVWLGPVILARTIKNVVVGKKAFRKLDRFAFLARIG